MARKASVAVVATALLLSGLFAGVSYGGARRDAREIVAPQTIELREGKVLGEAGPHVKARLLDQDGARAGVIVWECADTRVSWTCTDVLTLKAGPYAEHGSIVVSGVFRGFTGERLAVTGGTGAYANARGTDTLTVEGGRFTHTLSLLP